MTGSMRTFVTDRRTDGRTDGAGFIRTRWASPNKNKNEENKISNKKKKRKKKGKNGSGPDQARPHLGMGPDLIWAWGPGPDIIWEGAKSSLISFDSKSLSRAFTLRVISFSKCRDATNHSNCRKKFLKKIREKLQWKKNKKKGKQVELSGPPRFFKSEL